MSGKKKFKDTKVGRFLSKAAPGILGTVGDILPDSGVFGVCLLYTSPSPRD